MMYTFFVGMVLVAFQVACDAAPGRSFPVPELPSYVFQDEKHVDKRIWPGATESTWATETTAATETTWATETTPATEPSAKTTGATETTAAIVTTAEPETTNNENACLKAHNDKRALHGAPALVWDATLAQHAQAWADHLAATRTFVHEKNTGEGENLYALWSSGSSVGTCSDAVQAWYNEIKDYSYNNPGYSPATGHFTQVVWKGTTRVGAAVATRKDKDSTNTYVVARYYPPGNVIGQFAQNVG